MIRYNRLGKKEKSRAGRMWETAPCLFCRKKIMNGVSPLFKGVCPRWGEYSENLEEKMKKGQIFEGII